MKEIFLVAALALPWSPKGEYQMLVRFLQLNPEYRGYEIILVNDDENAVGDEYRMTPYIINGQRAWLKRST